MKAVSLLAMALAIQCVALPSRATPPVLIRDATVHTMSSAGVLQHTDILISDGKIAEMGHGLSAPANAEIIDAGGRPVTPGLFGGLGHLGIEEISEEPVGQDYSLKLGAMRPEFDVTPAFNPDSVVLGVNRIGGITFAMLAPSAVAGKGAAGTIIAGQGSMARLDGTVEPLARALFVDVGGDASVLSGGSRAAQFMLLQQAIGEVRSPKSLLPGDARLLTPLGRQALATYVGGDVGGAAKAVGGTTTNGSGAPIVFDVDRASDIRQVISFAQREKLHLVIKGATEAWRVATELAAAQVPVLLNPLDDLPESFDAVGATLENAARLQHAGVKIAFTFDDPAPHNIRRLRQAAGIAVAHGLPWEDALAAITRNPAEIFGVTAANGSLARGRPADLVLWSGDPLEVTTLADRVFIQGVAQSMHSRQTELRDRYLLKLRANAAR
ncbi:MAG: amidohydrolase [Gammaproteobacteria bacterium]|nr:amidohydrolase [Gammaproteobacteria bacterium]